MVILRLKNIKIYVSKLGPKATIYYFLKRIFFKRNRIISIKLPGIPSKIRLRNKSYDTHIFFQIFIKEELIFIQNAKIILDTIIDAGANIGLSTVYLKNKFPNASIISIEPSSLNYDLLKQNVKDYDNVNIIKAALTGNNKRVWISNPSADYASFRVTDTCLEGEGVEAFSLSHLMKISGFEKIDFIKIDIEGSEKEVFEQIDDETLTRVQSLAVEMHGLINPGVETIIGNKLSQFKSVVTGGEYSYYVKL